jgi:hypothetical protein
VPKTPPKIGPNRLVSVFLKHTQLEINVFIFTKIFMYASGALKAGTVVRHPKRHPANIYASMTLPTRPYAIFSTLQGTQNPDTKPTLQRAKNANALPTHPG